MQTNLPRRSLLATLASTIVLPAAAQSPPQPSLAEGLAAYAAGLHFSELGEGNVELVKAHVIDALCCAISAFNEAPVRSVRSVALAKAVARRPSSAPGNVSPWIGPASPMVRRCAIST